MASMQRLVAIICAVMLSSASAAAQSVSTREPRIAVTAPSSFDPPSAMNFDVTVSNPAGTFATPELIVETGTESGPLPDMPSLRIDGQPPGWTCTYHAQPLFQLSCKAEKLDPGTIVFRLVHAFGSLLCGKTVTVRARLSLGKAVGKPIMRTANTPIIGTANTQLGNSGDIGIGVEASPASPGPGDEVTYTIRITNAGPVRRERPSFTVPIAPDLSFLGWYFVNHQVFGPTFGCMRGSSAIQCTSSITLSETWMKLVFKVDGSAAAGAALSRTFTLSPWPSCIDTNPANNSATATVTVSQ